MSAGSAGGAVVVIGAGNPLRGDDGAGPAVVRALRRLALPSNVTLVEIDADLVGAIDLWQGAPRAILVDAMVSGAPPGSVEVLPLSATAGREAFAGASSHGLGVATAVGLARALGRLPKSLTLVGIEVEGVALGVPMSPAVCAGVERVVALLAQELAPLASGAPKVSSGETACET